MSKSHILIRALHLRCFVLHILGQIYQMQLELFFVYDYNIKYYNITTISKQGFRNGKF